MPEQRDISTLVGHAIISTTDYTMPTVRVQLARRQYEPVAVYTRIPAPLYLSHDHGLRLH